MQNLDLAFNKVNSMIEHARANGIPIIDADPFAAATLIDPWALHSQMRDAGPVCYISKWNIFGIARHSDVMNALKDFDNYSSVRGVGLTDFAHEAPWRPQSLLLETDPPEHDRTRSLANKVVSLASLKQVREAWSLAADALIDELVARRRFDGIKDLAEIYPQRVFADTIGLRKDGRERLLPYATANFNAFGPRNDIFEATEPARLAASEWIEESCTRPFIAPGSWGAAFFAAADRGECTEAEATRLVRSMITAGFDTTINGLGNLLNAMAEYPEAWAQLRDNPTLIKRAFEETLRLSSTVQTFFRTTRREVEIGESVVPEGAKVLLFLGSANRDPRRWTDPDRFILDRVTIGHVAFGFGVHQCLGQMVARQEAELLLTALVKRVARIKRAGPVCQRPNNTLYALSSLPLEVEPA